MAYPEQWASATWDLLAQSAPWFLVGLVLAGLVWYFIGREYLQRFLGRSGWPSVLRAAVLGLPLPLCSCSVLPVALQMRQMGASRGSTAAFLISTPETGIDSIALTYSLTDPILTVARPITAFVTALAAGSTELAFPDDDAPNGETQSQACESNGSCDCESGPTGHPEAGQTSLIGSIKYAFTDLLAELSPYLAVGFLVAGVVGVLLGDSFVNLPDVLVNGWGGYGGAILIGLPLYICATSSTPVAAVLLSSGFSPGMILVFLLVGPATNLSALAVLRRILGAAGVVRYLLVIIVVSLAAGLLVDQLYDWLDVRAGYVAGDAHVHGSILETVCGAVLGVLILWYAAQWFIGRVRSFTLSRGTETP